MDSQFQNRVASPLRCNFLLCAVMDRYRTIVIDPPWKYGKWGTPTNRVGHDAKPLPYETMSVWEISRLPVERLAADNCELYLWTTQKFLPDSFGVLKQWGFRYCQTLSWCKTPRGTGQGGMFTPTTEFLVLGRRGKAPTGKRRVDSTWWNQKREHNAHSRKPEFFQDMIEEVTEGPRLEMFARRKRPGWDVWGNEVESDIELQLGT